MLIRSQFPRSWRSRNDRCAAGAGYSDPRTLATFEE